MNSISIIIDDISNDAEKECIMQISYLRVNLAKVLIGFDSKKDDLRLSRLLMSLLPSDNLDKNDWRRFKLALILLLGLSNEQ